MRRIDKKLNLQKVNMLTEQRYLQSKGLLKENGPETDKEATELKKGDKIVWVGEPRVIGGDMTVKPGDKGEYIGRETSGEWVVEFGSRRFHTSDTTFEKVNKGGFNEFNSNKRIDEMDYEREITKDDFRWLSKFPGWYPVKLDNGVFAIKNDNYPIISYEVSIADYNSGGHQTFGKPVNQEHPWKFIVKKAVNPDAFLNKSYAPEGFIVIDGGQTSDIESSFSHFLKHKLIDFKQGEKLNLQNR